MTKPPRVSIGIPVYNGERYLAGALDSLLAQTYPEFEILISDNASTDRTSRIAQTYAARDGRVRYFRQNRNLGAGPNHNFLLDQARSRYFKWAANDDLYEPDYLAECIALLDRNPDVALAHSDSVLIDAQGKPLPYDIFRRCCIDRAGNILPKERIDVCESDLPDERFDDVLQKLVWCTAMYGLFRRDLAEQLTLERNFYGSDKVFLAEMALLGRFQHVKAPLFKKRYHAKMSAQLSAKERSRFMDTSAPASLPYVALFKGYLNAALKIGPLGPTERLRCVGSVAKKTVKARYLRHRLVA